MSGRRDMGILRDRRREDPNYDESQLGSWSSGTSNPSAREFGGTLKLLLTSGGVTNPSIHSALVELLGKPIADCRALCVPTAQWGHPMCGPASVRGLVAAEPVFQYLTGLGWAS